MHALQQLINTIQHYQQPIQKTRGWGWIGNAVKLQAPATDEDIQKIETEIGYSLTDELRQMYKFANGITLTVCGQKLQFLPVEDTLKWAEIFSKNSKLPHFKQAFPFMENNDSNPWCICCTDTLRGYVLHIPHDDDAEIKYRNLNSFLAALSWYILPWLMWQQPDSDDNTFADEDVVHESILLESMPTDIEQNIRTLTDIQGGRALLDVSESLSQWDRVWGLSFATSLLAPYDAAAIEKYLYDMNIYVSRDAYRKLSQKPELTAQRAIRQFDTALHDFAMKGAEVLRDAGFEVSEIRHGINGAICIEPGPTWLDTLIFFLDTEHTDRYTYLVDRATYFFEMKTKRQK